MSHEPENVTDQSISEHVSLPLRVAAAWSWRGLVVIATFLVVGWALLQVRTLLIACLIALLLALLLAPFVSYMRTRWKMGKTLSAAIGLISGLLATTALFSLALGQLINQLPTLITQTLYGLDRLLDWVADGPWGIEPGLLTTYFDNFQTGVGVFVRDYGGVIASEAWTFASSAVSVSAATLIMLFVLFFMLKDGRAMWVWFLRTLPVRWRHQANEAGIRGWVTLGWYIRTQLKVAAIDAVGIGLGALALGVPAAVPIMVLVFFCSFVPIVGAFVSGAVAVLLALVNNGLTSALIMFVVVLAVQQLEGNVLHPWLMAQAVSLHPVAVVLSVTAGAAVAGIFGAVFAVPLLAFLNVTILYLHGHDMYPQLATDPLRPGGPPGSLDAQIAASYTVAHAAPRGKGNADAGRAEVAPADPEAVAEVIADEAEARDEAG